jgi:four helix bundle protein
MENREPRTENRYSYRNLILWGKGQGLALDVIRLVAALPEDRVTRIISDQILRSAFSISANVAEGHGRYSLGAHRNHLTIAKGSACETDNFLDLLRRAEYISTERESQLHSRCDEIIRMLVSKIVQMEKMEQEARRQP